MKKVFIVLMVLLSSMLTAQEIKDINGTVWREWSLQLKQGYIIGFIASGNAMAQRDDYLYCPGEDHPEADEFHKELFDRYIFIGAVSEYIMYIDDFYSNDENLEEALINVIFFIAGKAYWIEQEPVTQTNTQPLGGI